MASFWARPAPSPEAPSTLAAMPATAWWDTAWPFVPGTPRATTCGVRPFLSVKVRSWWGRGDGGLGSYPQLGLVPAPVTSKCGITHGWLIHSFSKHVLRIHNVWSPRDTHMGKTKPRCFQSREGDGLLLCSWFVMSSLWPHGLQHASLPCPSLFPGVCSDSCPVSQWRYLTISSSVAPFSSCLQSFPASGFFLTSRLFASGGQSIGASASASILPMNIQGWFP